MDVFLFSLPWSPSHASECNYSVYPIPMKHKGLADGIHNRHHPAYKFVHAECVYGDYKYKFLFVFEPDY
jgi:hypothetical protein